MKNKLLILFFLGFSSLLIGQETAEKVKLKKELELKLADTSRVSTYLKIAKLYLKSDPDSSLAYYTKALKLAKKTGNPYKIADVINKIGYFYEVNNKYQEAIKNYKDSFLNYKKLNNKNKMASIYNVIGKNYSFLNSEDEAIEYYLKSLKLYKELSNNSGIAKNYTSIGNLYYAEGNYEFAEKYFRDALLIYEKLDDKYGISSCFTNIANTLADNGKVEEGLDYYKKSIAIEEKLNDQEGIASNYNNIGDCYMNLEQYEKALEYFHKALKIAENNNIKNLRSLVYLNIAEIENKRKNYQNAIYAARKSYAIADEISNIDYKTANLLHAAIAYEGLGDNILALKRLKKYTVLKDSMIKIDRVEKIKLFNALNDIEKSQFTINDLSKTNEIAKLKYENEKRYSHFLILAMIGFAFFLILLILQNISKKKANNLLEFKNYQIKKMNAEIHEQSNKLRQANSTKDKFFSIIAHDLKNPFNSIAGFTDLLIENNDKYDESKQLKFLKIIKESTAKVSNLLDNLLIWANSQSGNLKYNPKNIVLAQHVPHVISFLEIQAINKDITILNKVEDNIFVNADENMMNTILRNLISNAIKFTPPKGEIQICATLKNDFIEVAVKDNGVGIAESALNNIFNVDEINSSLGTSNEKGSGLGLMICKDFVENHGGKIWVESTENKGSEFKFTVPVWKDMENTVNKKSKSVLPFLN
ncbi:MAG: tetratricopeptide repeat-containing sensor histidine kinase [Lutibacter sp.]|jgi:signal transduction histidine kinase/Tfp pilus assembly protein PilF